MGECRKNFKGLPCKIKLKKIGQILHIKKYLIDKIDDLQPWNNDIKFKNFNINDYKFYIY